MKVKLRKRQQRRIFCSVVETYPFILFIYFFLMLNAAEFSFKVHTSFETEQEVII